ncbi:serine/threonine-protein phosphatase [Candidatus Sumerlaeota bacterium]|nr:serine/threonine-protein phosphatase [Candidatus Sumerlaeota bacterium]
MKIDHVELTHVGNVRKRNEDSIFSMPERGIFLVADGMGGEKAGAEASQQVVGTVEKVVRRFFDSKPPEAPRYVEAVLRDSLEQANRDVYELSVEDPEKTGLGSTGSLLCVHRGLYFMAQVGDSRIYLIRDGEVKQITRDHTVVWQLYQEGMIDRDQLETHPERHLLTQCIGTAQPPKVDTFQGKLQENDLFLACSDGLTGYAGEETVIRLIREEAGDLKSCADKLVEAALKGGGGDNISVMLVRIESLGEDDDWEPKAPPTPIALSPKKPEPEAKDAEPDTAPEPGTAGKRSWTLIIGGILGAAALLAFVFYVITQTGSFTVRFTVDPVVDLENASIELFDSEGQPVLGAVQVLDDNDIEVKLPHKGNYMLRLKASGFETHEVDVSSDGAGPYTIRPARTGGGASRF